MFDVRFLSPWLCCVRLLMAAFSSVTQVPLGRPSQGYINVSSLGDLQRMFRVVAVLLIVWPILDVYVLDGRYTETAGRILYSASQRFR
jgi:hypothetical protein